MRDDTAVAGGDLLEDYRKNAFSNYGGSHQNLVQRYLFGDEKQGGVHVNANLTNVGQVQRRLLAEIRSQGLNKGGFIKRLNKQVFKPLKGSVEKAGKQKRKQKAALTSVGMYYG